MLVLEAAACLQGIMFKRSKILKDSNSQFMPQDLLVGEMVNIYGKVILITDADEHTRMCALAWR